MYPTPRVEVDARLTASEVVTLLKDNIPLEINGELKEVKLLGDRYPCTLKVVMSGDTQIHSKRFWDIFSEVIPELEAKLGRNVALVVTYD